MSSIFGILSKAGKVVDDDEFQKAMGFLAVGSPDVARDATLGPAHFAAQLFCTTPESKEEILPYLCHESSLLIAADARIDYRDELINRLEPKKLDPAIPDSQLLLHAYRRWGKDCLRYLYGDFAFVIWDDHNKELFCARDHFGCRPLYYYNDEHFFIFSSEVRAILAISSLRVKISGKRLIRQGTSMLPLQGETLFDEIGRLEPAHFLRYGEERLQKEKYWEVAADPALANISEAEAIRGLRMRMENAVKQRVRGDFRIGIELSGGLDSSGVAALVSGMDGLSSDDVHAFSQVLPDDLKGHSDGLKDERHFSAMVARHVGIYKHHFISGEERGALDAMKDSLALNRSPVLHSYAMFTDELLDKVSGEGIRILLSGFGGDEGVSSRTHGYLEELASLKKWDLLKRELSFSGKAKLQQTGIMMRYRIQFLLPFLLPLVRRLGRRRRLARKRYRSFPLSRFWKRKYKTRKNFLGGIGDVQWNSVQKYQFHRLTHPSNQERFEQSGLQAKSRGIEYRYPFWDVKLIEYFYGLPTSLKVKDGVSRLLYRKAMSDILPPEICWRKDKSGATIPGIFRRLQYDIPAFSKLIEEQKDYEGPALFNAGKLKKQIQGLEMSPGESRDAFGLGLFIYAMTVLCFHEEKEKHFKEMLRQNDANLFASDGEIRDVIRYRHRIGEGSREQRATAIYHSTEMTSLYLGFRNEAIHAIPIKGPVLSQQLYDDPGIRSSVDLDFLVPDDQVLNAIDFLAGQGFRLINPQGCHSKKHWRYYFKFKKDVRLLRDSDNLLLEIHSDIYYPFLYRSRLSLIFKNLDQVEFGGRELQVLQPEINFLYLAIHGANHQYFRLFWLRDVAYALKKWELDHRLVLGYARDMDVQRLLGVSLLLAREYFGIATPKEYADYLLEEEKVLLELVENCRMRIRKPENLDRLGKLKKHQYFMNLRPGLAYKFRVLLNIYHRWYIRRFLGGH